MRDVRKEIAQAEGVPVYTIFTNEQLAQQPAFFDVSCSSGLLRFSSGYIPSGPVARW